MLSLSGVSKQYGSKILFQGADAHIGPRSRMALIGPNGSGKSTLIRILLGYESADSGQVSRPPRWVIGHLAQEVPRFEARTVLEEVMRLGGRRDELLKERVEWETRFSGGAAPESNDLERYGRVLEELEDLDEYRMEARAKEILGGMGFAPTDFGRNLSEFSGGWLMRVALSRLLVIEPDLLLLDEPTNHLDLESLLWLEEFLRGFRGAFLLVSHDTEFLNRLATEVLEIDQNRIITYRGNLDAYATQKQERLEVLRSQYVGQQARIQELEKFISRFRAKATKAKQAQSRVKQLEKIERIELPEDRARVRFRFPPVPHGGREVVTVRGAEFSYGDHRIFKDLHWTIQRGSRVAIVGVNGAGKTTLLKLLSGSLRPTAGELRHGHQIQIGYYAQHQADSLDLKKTVLKELELTAPELPVSQIRGIAGAFLFSGDAVEKVCGVLSGGEKARVALAKLLLSPSNFLLLDEPTNHLDVESRGVLLEALQDYEGTLCLISHDRSFISPLVDSVLEIKPGPGGSEVLHLTESYDDYLARVQRDVANRARDLRPARDGTPNVKAAAEPPSTKGPSNNQRKAWEKQRDLLESQITQLESELAKVNEILADTQTYLDKPLSLKTIERERVIKNEINVKMREWETLCQNLG